MFLECGLAADVLWAGDAVCVCNQLFIDRYMWPEGPWQRLAAALAGSSGVLPAHILSQIEMIDPSRAPLSPAPKKRPPDIEKGENRQRKKPGLSLPLKRKRKESYTAGGPGPPSSPSSPEPALVASSGTTLLDLIHLFGANGGSRPSMDGLAFHYKTF